jgi:translocation and assembly module TamB
VSNPAIHFVATSTANNTVATLTISGTAQAPKITLSSQPELPQDQILALLLFQSTTGSLTPLQAATIASGLAQISGAGGNLANPLAGLQNALGLDQRGVGSSASGSPTLQAGRYIGRRLYVGMQQGTGGTGGQAVVQYRLTPRLKLNATAGSGTTTTAIGATGQSNGESVGLIYQFQY